MRLATVSVLLCVVFSYGMATTQSRILSDAFPIISETFVGKPQSSVSEFILGWASLVLFGTCWTMKTYAERYASSDARWRRRARRRSWFGYVASAESRQRKARETLQIYAPLADRIGMRRLAKELQALGFEVLPSAANFVFARHPRHDAATLSAQLRERRILVRHFKAPRIDQFLRITVGTNAQCDALVEALQDIV